MENQQRIIVIFLIIAIVFSLTSIILSISISDLDFIKIRSGRLDGAKSAGNIHIEIEGITPSTGGVPS